ncbi:MAG: hypothetical protein PHP57_08005 [Sideroxydans sp.]|nr:hypothetical protein [Sideroxydans sp.]
MRSLWPPIEVIASKLQNGSGSVLHFPDRSETSSESVDIVDSEMPAFIRDKVRKRIATREAHFDTQPKAGQIWRFDGLQNNLAPSCVLLDHPKVGKVWSGWFVSPETDYASNRDVLLEPKDEPFDPIAAMVQTWNPVSVDISKGSKVLALLASDRMAAMREVANGECEEGGGARAGFVAPLKTHSGAVVLSGTCITHPEDSRRQYQTLYRTAAQTLEQQHSTSNVVQLPQRSRFNTNVGWAIAASVMLVQTVIIANMMGGQSKDELRYEHSQEYRAVPQAPVNYAYLEVYFKPDAKAVDIRKLLTQLNASIVDGPGEFGQYRVRVNENLEQDVLKNIQASGLVDSVTALEPSVR